MLWFNFRTIIFWYLVYNISIHLMLWFNPYRCSGKRFFIHFNTSYVMVQPSSPPPLATLTALFQYILCYGSTCRTFRNRHSCNRFQYILCYGSTGVSLRFYNSIFDFNTSYVMVQHLIGFQTSRLVQNFNTSYVMVQRFLIFLSSSLFSYFNTSYVMVQHFFAPASKCFDRISIHLMLWFNLEKCPVSAVLF